MTLNVNPVLDMRCGKTTAEHKTINYCFGLTAQQNEDSNGYKS